VRAHSLRRILSRGVLLLFVAGLAIAASHAGTNAKADEPSAWTPYEAPANDTGSSSNDVVVSGGFEESPNGVVTGALPPGVSKDDLPVDTTDPASAQRLQDGDLSRLHTEPAPPNASDSSSPSSSSSEAYRRAALRSHKRRVALRSHKVESGAGNAGCTNAFSHISAEGLAYKGNMAGCRYGILEIHTYLHENGHHVQDGETIVCSGDTQCSVPYSHYSRPPGCGEYTNYAHGINYTTGWSMYAYQEHFPHTPYCE